jgi:hypothetical protein
MSLSPARLVALVLALLLIGASLWQLRQASAGLRIQAVDVRGIPATVFAAAGDERRPAIVIAHGFAGSQQLMRAFALTFAQAGYLAVTFDFAGHGRNPAPLTGNITEATGATQTLVRELAHVADFARARSDGRLVVLGHSMASDIVVRFAQATPDVRATIAVSMFSPAVTATSPPNLLIVSGEWEGMLRREALRVVGLSAGAEAQAGVTYGAFGAGTARRASISASVEHVGVLYSQDTLREALAWADAALGVERAQPPALAGVGPWILALLAGAVLLAWPLARLLPVVAAPSTGAALPWRRLWLPVLLPALLTPLVLRFVPTHFLPVVVGDYLAVHFALYGALTGAWLLFARKWRPAANDNARPIRWTAFAVAVVATVAFGFVAIVWPIHTHVTAFVPGGIRPLLILALLAGTLSFFIATEWLARGSRPDGRPAAPGAHVAIKVAFLLSLGIAVALDFQRLFFLLIIIPVMVPFLLVYGLFSAWVYGRTGHPWVAAVANAVAFAWAIGVTFPILAG